MTEDTIPQWAAKRALELMRAESSSAMWSRDCYADRALARYIAAHEEAPVDPLESVLAAVGNDDPRTAKEEAERLRFRLAEAGLKIVEAF